jgi:hypothetical protein
MKNSMEAPQKTKTELPYNPSIVLRGIYLRNVSQVTIKTDTCTYMFIIALFTISKL